MEPARRRAPAPRVPRDDRAALAREERRDLSGRRLRNVRHADVGLDGVHRRRLRRPRRRRVRDRVATARAGSTGHALARPWRPLAARVRLRAPRLPLLPAAARSADLGRGERLAALALLRAPAGAARAARRRNPAVGDRDVVAAGADREPCAARRRPRADVRTAGFATRSRPRARAHRRDRAPERSRNRRDRRGGQARSREPLASRIRSARRCLRGGLDPKHHRREPALPRVLGNGLEQRRVDRRPLDGVLDVRFARLATASREQRDPPGPHHRRARRGGGDDVVPALLARSTSRRARYAAVEARRSTSDPFCAASALPLPIATCLDVVAKSGDITMYASPDAVRTCPARP